MQYIIVKIYSRHKALFLPSPPQGSVVSQSAIDQAYNDLLQQTEQFLLELQSRQEQQRIEEEEAERMRKVKEEQVRKAILVMS